MVGADIFLSISFNEKIVLMQISVNLLLLVQLIIGLHWFRECLGVEQKTSHLLPTPIEQKTSHLLPTPIGN